IHSDAHNVVTKLTRIGLGHDDILSAAPHGTTDQVSPIRAADPDRLAATFTDLISRYVTTTYLNGQSTIALDGDTAAGETYCLALHVLYEGGERVLLTMSIRYLDTFARTDEGWLIQDRQLIFDWTDRRPSAP
ncbi:nuclear transport factor 2 family protein, partial [Microbacterium oxydans]|uniref:nuclear transport factor 2 family protein n=1 Tax=Microbacterium oxydans TaxID=82380 RepID=UPI000AF7D6E0